MEPESDRPTLSLVLPVYNEEAVLPELDRRLRAFLADVGASWEVVFIDDGSKDGSLALLQEMARSEERFRVLSFSRNFGHQLAITAGVDFARGDAVVIMDSDLQDPPEVVREMLARWREGYDVVYGVRRARQKETLFKRATAALFYRLLRALVGVTIPVDAGDFRLMSRRVVLTLRALREASPFVRGMVAWVGFKQIAVTYERAGRFAGSTHYPLRKMLKFAIDGITAFSTVPLRLATWLGALAGVGAILIAGWALWVGMFSDRAVPGWTTIVIIVSVAASVQLVMMGVLGEYVGRIYDQVKGRPLYVLQQPDDGRLAAEKRRDVAHATARERPQNAAHSSVAED